LHVLQLLPFGLLNELEDDEQEWEGEATDERVAADVRRLAGG
jgi:hypothetical protein